MRKLIILLGVLLLGIFMLGCGYPDIKEITPSQTAFLIPLTGDSSKQVKLDSEESLKKNQVSGKRVTIPKERVRGHGYLPTMQLIIVERKPETREWTEVNTTGTSTKNEGITAETKESIGFTARMNCSAQIDEIDAAKFLYRYNNKSLADIMDTEIRSKIESKFVEQCSKYTLEDLLLNKESIMSIIKDDTITYFKERGINITTLGLKGELTYLNPEIQKVIDEKFKTAQALVSQKNENERKISAQEAENTTKLSKAKADAEAASIQASTIEKTIELKRLENQSEAVKKWNGAMPKVVSDGGNIMNIPLK